MLNCCVIGYHGTSPVGKGAGSTNSDGNANVQTFARASWVQPGLFARPNGGTDWALQDIHALSHEISEWADDPFLNNVVEPWLTATAPVAVSSRRGPRRLDRLRHGYEPF